jgi:hypothetical protein
MVIGVDVDWMYVWIQDQGTCVPALAYWKLPVVWS